MKYRRRFTWRQVLRAIIIAVVCAAAGWTMLAVGQPPQPKRQAVVVSADWFDCMPCEKAADHLKSVGVEVTVVKLSQEEMREAGIKSIPTVFVGQKYVGLGEVKGGVR